MKLASALILVTLCAMAFAFPVAQREFAQVLTRTPDLQRGAKLYEACAACHGKQGEGVSDGSVPVLAGQSFNVLAKQIVDFRSGLRGDPRMVHSTDTRHLSFSQPIADVAGYIATLPATKPTASSTSDAGALTYARACKRCHKASGEGSEDSLAPRLASQHPEYMLRQLEDAAANRRPEMNESHAALVSSLSRDELAAVVRYVSTLGR